MVRRARMAYRVSERRACRVLGQARSTQRYDSVAEDQAVLRGRIKEIAGVHVTWGYRRHAPKTAWRWPHKKRPPVPGQP